jgi:hypothetical protein
MVSHFFKEKYRKCIISLKTKLIRKKKKISNDLCTVRAMCYIKLTEHRYKTDRTQI